MKDKDQTEESEQKKERIDWRAKYFELEQRFESFQNEVHFSNNGIDDPDVIELLYSKFKRANEKLEDSKKLTLDKWLKDNETLVSKFAPKVVDADVDESASAEGDDSQTDEVEVDDVAPKKLEIVKPIVRQKANSVVADLSKSKVTPPRKQIADGAKTLTAQEVLKMSREERKALGEVAENIIKAEAQKMKVR